MTDQTGWLGGQAPFAKMPDGQLRALVAEVQIVNGTSRPGINSAAALYELQMRRIPGLRPLTQEGQ